MDSDRLPAPTHGMIPVRTFLWLLLAADAVFVAVHLVHALSPYFNDLLYSIEQDRGYAEIYQYVKTFWIVLMLAALAWSTRESVHVAWMLLYTHLLFDDAFFIHEDGGAAIAARFDYVGALGLRPEDLGELTISALIGIVFLGLFLITYRRASRAARDASSDLVLLLGVLVFFGVFIDMLHIIVEPASAKLALAIIEDGGEMVTMSLTCWYVLGLLERRGQVPAILWRRLARR
jgi:hypothetical protein